jgi:two-component system chemotaxis response regulator CheB
MKVRLRSCYDETSAFIEAGVLPRSVFLSYKHIVVIGTSAGGVNALMQLASRLPLNFSAPIFVVLHIHAAFVSYLPELLNRQSQLIALHPVDGQTIQSGHIYIAPPNLHMILSDHKIYLRFGPKVNYCRPAIDPLFFSAAQYGASTIGVLLTGMLSDGVAGLLAIKKNKGTTVIQDLDEAEFQDMPKHALACVPIDYCLTIENIASILATLVLDNA